MELIKLLSLAVEKLSKVSECRDVFPRAGVTVTKPLALLVDDMGLDARKPVFGVATTKAQSDQRICYSRIEKYHILTGYDRNFNDLASLCSPGDWFESHFVGNPEDRFCRVETQ